MQVNERSDAADSPTQTFDPVRRNVIAVIGIDRYQAWKPLSNAVRDAVGAAALFQRLGFTQIIEPLLDERATGKALQQLVTDDLANLGPDDSLVLFYAGHGGTRRHDLGDQEVKTGYLIPVDASDSPNKVATWIELEGWLRAVSLLRAKHILVILDACYSGVALGPIIKWRDVGSWQETPLSTLNARRSRRIITSALDEQIALDTGPVDGHSLFTGCLIEALTHGLHRDGNRVITGSELGVHLQRRVKTYPLSQQTPDFGTFAFDDRGEMLIPLMTHVAADSADVRTIDRRARARRMLSDAYERWIEHERRERRLLDLETIIEIVTHVDHETVSAEMSQFIDQSASYNIDSSNNNISIMLDFIKGTQALDNPHARFARLLQHPSLRLRAGAVRLVQEFDRQVANQLLLEHVAKEHNHNLVSGIVAYLRGVGIAPSRDVAEQLLAKEPEWMTAAWALTGAPGKPAALLLGDGSDFARDMGKLVTKSGFRVVDEPDRSLFLHGGLDALLLASFSAIVVIRGENYFRGSDDGNYNALASYVRHGGILFMTPWVAWETVRKPFATILPFQHVKSSHNEGVTLYAYPAETQLAQELFEEPLVFEASYEELSPHSDTTVLLHGDNKLPLYGFRSIGEGVCHYLNVCQHHCNRPMKSPLRAEAFAHAMERIWRWIHNRCSESTNMTNARVYFTGHGLFHGSPVDAIPVDFPDRYASCPCNSGKAFVHCCGRLVE